MQLSRKGWNNVLIFSMLLMIFFFNGLHKKLNNVPEAQGVQAVLPAQSFVLALTFPEQKIERIGTAWRSQQLQSDGLLSDKFTTQQHMASLVAQWQGLELTLAETQTSEQTLTPIYVATLWLAGEQLPFVYQLFDDGKQYYLFDKQQQRMFILKSNVATQLFPLINIRQSESNA